VGINFSGTSADIPIIHFNNYGAAVGINTPVQLLVDGCTLIASGQQTTTGG
jgi:hypothetical protein